MRAFFQKIFILVFLIYLGYSLWATFYYDPNPKNVETALEKWKKVPLDLDSLQSGDLVLRHGKGFISDLLIAFNNEEKKYSHSGLIHREGKKLFVYNSIGGESRESNKMLKERFEIFVHPDIAFDFGIFRYDMPENQLISLDSLLGAYFQSGLEFDMDFDMYSEDKMYCSEMIYKAILLVTKDKNYLPLSRIQGKPYVAIDDLYLNSHCKQILEYNYD